MDNNETEDKEAESVGMDPDVWGQNMAFLAVNAESLFNDKGEINFTFQNEGFIYSIFLKKEANNIIPFPQPQKKKLPPRI